MKLQSDVPAGYSADELLHQLRQQDQARFFEFQRQMRGLLALIRAVVRRSAAAAVSAEDFATHLEGRLDAISRVHGILMRAPGAVVDLMELVSEEFLAQVIPDNRVETGGPPVALSGKAACSIALALHELATNALKFGALSTPRGRVSVIWCWDAEDPRSIRLEWCERGVTLDSAPHHKGFGMELIERTLPYELRARVNVAFAADGLQCVIVFQPEDPERLTLDRDVGGHA